MKISIVIPAYGNLDALRRSLATLRAQTLQPHEIIVVDDDGLPSVPLLDGIRVIRVTRNERKRGHRGSSAAKNLGARAATGTHLCFCDSDILHMPDALESLSAAATEEDARDLLNVFRVSLPQGYPLAYTEDLEALTAACGTAGLLTDEEMTLPVCVWEQNCGLIRADLFWELGGYDEQGFPSWGFNNQDLCARVILNGGHITSNIKRLTTGRRLYCYHMWHENHCDKERAEREWTMKWGESFSPGFMRTLYALAEAGDISKYADKVRRAA